MPDLPIRALLDLSTAHLSEKTRDDLKGFTGVTAYPLEHGWLMHVPEAELADDSDRPPKLPPILELARANNCVYVLFDRDAPTIDRLRTFD